MMDESQVQIETLAKNIDQYEQKVRQRAWISALVPLLFGGILLGYTIWQIQFYGQKLGVVQRQLSDTSQELGTTITNLQDTRAQLNQADTDLGTIRARLAQTTRDLEKTRAELDQTKKELEEANQELKDANVFLSNAFPIDIIDEKNSLASQYPEQADVLFYIQELQYSGVGWNRNGFSETEGFNSPNFAVYVLQHFRLISADYGADARPWEILRRVDRPSIGDIVYYEGGYTMFYYELNGEPFVIGMTPLGIISQKLHFAPILGYLRVPYHP